jgi:hypothetical protein
MRSKSYKAPPKDKDKRVKPKEEDKRPKTPKTLKSRSLPLAVLRENPKNKKENKKRKKKFFHSIRSNVNLYGLK